MSKRKFNRIQRVSDLIQTTLAEIMQQEMDLSSFGMITLTGVEVSQDMSSAKVFVSVLNDEKAAEAIAELNNATKFFRRELAHAVKLRITPELKFYFDDSVMRGQRISSLINDALKSGSRE
jgi:ribosome-binding factor A